MEFDNIGNHCGVLSCNQKDFLPFKCDVCGILHCLAHRSYSSHACVGSLSKDMTSVDCPICGKSIKFSKAENPNDIWETHYSLDCAPKPEVKKAGVSRCPQKSCGVILGPSNSFKCTKCHQMYCLSHRLAEEHNCNDMRHSKLLINAQPKSTTNPSIPTLKKNSNNSKPAGKSNKKDTDPSNTIYGTAQRRKQNNQQESNPSPTKTNEINDNTIFICPICSNRFTEQELLDVHLNFEHMDNNNNTIGNNNNAAQIRNNTRLPLNSGRERLEACPHCQVTFSDPVQLIQHVQQNHATGSSSSSRSANGNSSGCTVL